MLSKHILKGFLQHFDIATLLQTVQVSVNFQIYVECSKSCFLKRLETHGESMVLNIQFMMFYVWVSGNRGHPSYQTIEAGKLSTKLNSLTKPLIECVYSSCEAARICGKWLSIHWIDF